MTRILSLSFVVMALLATAVLSHPVREEANIVGSWNLTREARSGVETSLLTFKQEGGKLTGSIRWEGGEVQFDSVAVKGNEVTFVTSASLEGHEIVIIYKGKVEKDSMNGDATSGDRTVGTWSATRRKEAKN